MNNNDNNNNNKYTHTHTQNNKKNIINIIKKKKGIIEFFEKIEYLDSCYSKQYAKLASVLEPTENEYCKFKKKALYIYIYIQFTNILYKTYDILLLNNYMYITIK